MANELLGHEVVGDIEHYSDKKRYEQHDPALLIAAFDALFAFPEVVAVRWRQYTPYFNDGEACEFGVGDAGIRLWDTPDDAGDHEDGFGDVAGDWPAGYFDTHEWSTYRKPDDGKLPIDWSDRVFAYQGVERKDIQEAFRAVNAAVAGGHHEDTLYRTFGDPAVVTVDRDGNTYKFGVESFDHE